MKISIIIPTYNCGQYLEKAILSVLNQSYKNKELIVIDGGSSDNTIEILKKYKDKIKWISEKDNGQADAINKGFKMATGEIVTWLNADDYYEPNIFEDIVNEFKKNEDVVLVYGNCKSISKSKTIVNIPPNQLASKKLIRKGNFIFQPASFYKKNVVEKIGFLDDSLEFWMEYDLFIKLLQKGTAHHINKVLANFIIREDQKSNENNRLKMNNELLKISKKHGGNFYSYILLSNICYKLISLFKLNEKNN